MIVRSRATGSTASPEREALSRRYEEITRRQNPAGGCPPVPLERSGPHRSASGHLARDRAVAHSEGWHHEGQETVGSRGSGGPRRSRGGRQGRAHAARALHLLETEIRPFRALRG